MALQSNIPVTVLLVSVTYRVISQVPDDAGEFGVPADQRGDVERHAGVKFGSGRLIVMERRQLALPVS